MQHEEGLSRVHVTLSNLAILSQPQYTYPLSYFLFSLLFSHPWPSLSSLLSPQYPLPLLSLSLSHSLPPSLYHQRKAPTERAIDKYVALLLACDMFTCPPFNLFTLTPSHPHTPTFSLPLLHRNSGWKWGMDKRRVDPGKVGL